MQRLMKRSIYLSILGILLLGSIQAQYWQQYVEYDMNIMLDTDAKTLDATSELLYVNHSPDTLNQMLMHLYPNAYNEGTIALQVYPYYADSFGENKGWTGIQINEVLLDSVKLEFSIRDDSILDIQLNQPLFPGDTLRFSLDWKTLIHPFIERSGYTRQQFDFSQWYPKFVVYDENGWHDDPFGDWGEFYGEFGNFTIHFDIPEEQIIAATGIVIEGDPGWSEVTVDTSVVWSEWVEAFRATRGEKLAELDSSDRRQVTFFAENVHDYAWLCSPDFVYEHGSWNDIDVHALFTSQIGEVWTKDVVKHGESALQWLSGKFGPYPWPQITITKGLLSGGMEYPMLIMDSYESESLIVHEIGHNWFYGIFGNDELDEAWLDEGFSTFQTNWYKQVHYPDNGYDITRDRITAFESENLPRQMYIEDNYKSDIAYMISPRNEPISKRSYDFANYGSYGINVYDKASMMMQVLKNYLGEDRFLKGMALYYDRWALKHVNEERFIKSMEDATGEELDWLFDQWLHTTKYTDYKLTDWKSEELADGSYRTKISVENEGGLFVPLPATVYGDDGQTATARLKEFRFRDNGQIEINSKFKPIRVNLDAENLFLDTDRRNNDSQKAPVWRYNFKGWQEYPDHRNLMLWKPTLAFNDVAGLGLGLRLDRVYRIPGDFTALELSHNLKSKNPDVSLSFKEQHIGLPFQAYILGGVESWRSMTAATLAYEMAWAKIFWRNPVHYLTISIDFTDARNASVAMADQASFTRMSTKYELQHTVFGGNYGFSALFQYAPAALGTWNKEFSQLSLMSNWYRSYSSIKINNRSNFISNSAGTNELVKSRLASKNGREIYLNHLGTSLYQTDAIETLGMRYYLAGGARMRGYADSLDIPVNHLWSNNLDITLSTSPFNFSEANLSLFLDMGQNSTDGYDWDLMGDAGLGIELNPSWERNGWLTTLIRPFSLKFELPLARIENESWVSMLENNQWIFSITF